MIAGRYSLLRELGRGGMGAVWLAEDDVLGRLVALKRVGMMPGADGPDLARAEREARLAAQLSHPNVVAVFNIVADPETDAQWLVMEYVDGRALSRVLRDEGPLAPDDAAPILGQVARALVAAHAVGIVHRDVKPSNILVDRQGRVKLADFGIARTSADPALTQTGMLTGSPAYLAPEVANGERGDESADVWSLGATVFHVLAGRPPYDAGDNVLGTLVRIVNDEPPRLPDAGWMAPLLEATMVKDPQRRWTMAQVRDFLTDPEARAALTAARTPAADPERTQVMAPVPPAAAASPVPPETEPAPRPAARADDGGAPGRRRGAVLALVGIGLAVVAALALVAGLGGGDPGTDDAAAEPTGAASPADPSGADSSGPPETERPAGPTERGMKQFVRRYVDAVAADPGRSWRMLTPKFQRESGGRERYQEFWNGVGEPELLEVRADPDSLVVSYRVRFENFGTGERPTVLELVHDGGRYRIDGELTEGFEPAG